MGFSVTLAAGTGGVVASQASVEAATELGIQIWLKASKLRSLGSPRTPIIWIGDNPISGAQKVGFLAELSGSMLIPLMFSTSIGDYGSILDGSGNGLDITALVDTDDVVLYMAYAPTTGAFEQEAALFFDNGTQIGNDLGRNYAATPLPTTAGEGALILNFEQEAFANAETAGTIKRVAVWNTSLAGAARSAVPAANAAGLISLWGGPNGFTAGSGTSEPNQVSGGSVLTLDPTVTWNNIGGSGSTAKLAPRQQNGGRYN